MYIGKKIILEVFYEKGSSINVLHSGSCVQQQKQQKRRKYRGGDTPPISEITQQGQVIHSAEIAGAKVCYDRNGNKQCDAGEPNATTAANGTFSIKGTLVDANVTPLIAELPNTMSINNSIVFVAERASSKLIFETPAGLNKISSVTTLVKAKMDDEGSSTGDAWVAVASDLGVDENLDLDSNEVKAAGEKITAVMAAMITAIGGKTDLTLTALQSISLIMNEINKELAAIAAGTKTAEAIAKEKITDLTSDNLKKQADTVVASKPTTLTMGDLITSENGGLQLLN